MPYATIPKKLRLYYQDFSPDSSSASRPPIIFLHGFTVDHRMWGAAAAHFSQTHRVLLLDARGHGLSDAPPTGYSRADRVDDLVAAVDKLGVEAFHLVGLSMGGSTAIGYALRGQSRLKSLTLVSTGAAGWNVGLKISRIDQIARDHGLEAARAKWMEYSLRYYREGQEGIRDLIATMMREHSGAAWMDERRGKYPDPGKDLERVHTITVPTLIIAGEQDRVFVPLARILKERIPDARLHLYTGIGHMVNLEEPERFHADVEAFLDEIDAR